MIAAIVNPAAAAGAAGRRWPQAERLVTGRLGPLRVHFTKARGHAAELARALAEAETILVGGGDGTLNEVVNGILAAGSAARIGLLPLATGRDFARMLGLRSVAAAVDGIAGGRWRRVDVFRARFRSADGAAVERCFVNSASFALGGAVSAVAPQWRRWPGGLRYLAPAIAQLASGRSYALSVQLDREPARRFDVTTGAICNGQFQGGGICIAPEAAPDDGLADVTLVERVSLWEVLRRLPILYNGALYTYPKVRHWRAARVCVEGDAPLELDGEAVGMLPLEVAPAGTIEVAGASR